MSFAIGTNAQSCVISGADDGSTVEVKSCYLSGDRVIVNVINDSKDIAANVTVMVEVAYKCGTARRTQNYSGREISLAGVSTKIEIPINKTFSSNDCFIADSVIATSVSGNKCK